MQNSQRTGISAVKTNDIDQEVIDGIMGEEQQCRTCQQDEKTRIGGRSGGLGMNACIWITNQTGKRRSGIC